MNVLLVILYVLTATGGSTLIKYGGLEKVTSLFTVPIINLSISLASLIGILCYGTSFVLYIILLNRFDLSIISPLTVGLVYVLLMITAVLVFGESFSILKASGATIILAGVLLILIGK